MAEGAWIRSASTENGHSTNVPNVTTIYVCLSPPFCLPGPGICKTGHGAEFPRQQLRSVSGRLSRLAYLPTFLLLLQTAATIADSERGEDLCRGRA